MACHPDRVRRNYIVQALHDFYCWCGLSYRRGDTVLNACCKTAMDQSTPMVETEAQ